jgi:signal transduction histidine kinase
VALLPVIESTAAALEPLAQQRSVRVRIVGTNDAATPVDKAAIRMLFRNLIDNAIRYTPSNGKIVVLVRNCGLFNQVIVTDTWPGISEDEAPEMFRRFKRGL